MSLHYTLCPVLDTYNHKNPRKWIIKQQLTQFAKQFRVYRVCPCLDLWNWLKYKYRTKNVYSFILSRRLINLSNGTYFQSIHRVSFFNFDQIRLCYGTHLQILRRIWKKRKCQKIIDIIQWYWNGRAYIWQRTNIRFRRIDGKWYILRNFCGEHGLLTQAQKYRHELLNFCIQNQQIAVST